MRDATIATMNETLALIEREKLQDTGYRALVSLLASVMTHRPATSRHNDQRPQTLDASPECGHIDAKGPFPRIAVLHVHRRAPNRSNLLAEARPISTSVKCQDADGR